MPANTGLVVILLSLLTRLGISKPTLKLRPNWPLIFAGETVTLRCFGRADVRAGFSWSKFESGVWKLKHQSHENNYIISPAAVEHSGTYRCADSESHSNDLRVSMSDKPRPFLAVSPRRNVYSGESVSLSCEVTTPSAGWKYYWYKGTGAHALMTTTDKGLYALRAAAPTDTGDYSCRAGRGNPVWFAEYSCSIYIQVSALPKATLSVEPKWRSLYNGDTVTLKCGVDACANWRYFWYKDQLQTAVSLTEEYRVSITAAPGSEQGRYWCEGRLAGRNVTSQPSDSVTLTADRLVFGLAAAPFLLTTIILCVKCCRKSGSSNGAAARYTRGKVEID